MSGRARRATRPTPCLFGAALGLLADFVRSENVGVFARPRPPALGRAVRVTGTGSAGIAHESCSCSRVSTRPDRQQRRRARPSNQPPQESNRSQTAGLLDIRSRKGARPLAGECIEFCPNDYLAQLSQENGAVYYMALLSHSRYVAQDFFCDMSSANKYLISSADPGSGRYFLKIAATCSSVANRSSRMSAALCSSASRSSSDKGYTLVSLRSCFPPMSASVPDAAEFSGAESRRARVAFQQAMFGSRPHHRVKSCLPYTI